MTTSAIFEGQVTHQRHKPMGHRLRYGVSSVLIDLDELEGLDRRIPIFSHNRWNLVSFHDRDHGPRDGTPLRAWVERHMGDAGVDVTGGSIQLLAFPRLFGYVFNPITVWFARDRDGYLRGLLYEVHNTFGHALTHLVVLPEGMEDDDVPSHIVSKDLHVSPFFDREGSYLIDVSVPAERFGLHIEYLDPDGDLLLDATLRGRRVELTTWSLVRQFLRNPLLTIKVIGGIHLEAAKLFVKGAKYRSVPPPPVTTVKTTHLATKPVVDSV